MAIRVELTQAPIDPSSYRPKFDVMTGAVVEFSGLVRVLENDRPIEGIEYEAFQEMALHQLELIANEVAATHGLSQLVCVHRTGYVPVGQAAVYILTASSHREAAYGAIMEYTNRLKQVVPIWKHIRE